MLIFLIKNKKPFPCFTTGEWLTQMMKKNLIFNYLLGGLAGSPSNED